MRPLKVLFAFIVGLIMFVSCTDYSSGDRVGVITKFSKSGLVFKSHEGELKVAPNIASGGMVGQYETFAFSLDRDNTIVCETPVDSIAQFATEGIPVVISYQQVRFLNWWKNRGNTDYFVKSVKRASINNTKTSVRGDIPDQPGKLDGDTATGAGGQSVFD